MPNWKKVIVSGSDAVLNSVTAPAGFTGSLLGTASVATKHYTANGSSGTYYPILSNALGTANLDYFNNSGFSLNLTTNTLNTTSSYAVTASYAPTSSISDRTTRIDLVALNQTGGTLAKGTVVRIEPVSNASDTPRIVTASYESDALSAATLGITAEAISNGNTGYVITAGMLTGISTSGWSTGTLLFLGTGGAITATAPTAPLHGVRLGQVVREQSANGSIYVRVDNGAELGELHDVVDSNYGTTTNYGDLLVRSGSVWINSKQMTGSYGITGSLKINGPITFAGDSAGSNALYIQRNGSNDWTWGTSGIGNVMTIVGNSIGLPQVVTTSNGLNVTPGGNSTTYGLIVTSGSYPAATIFRAGVSDIVVTGSRVGFGTTTPTQKVDVVGSGQFSSQVIVGANTVASTEATLIIGVPPAGGAGEGGQLALQPATGYTSGSFIDNYQNKLRFLRGTATTSDAFKMQIDLQTGQLQLPNYTSTTSFAGTVAAALAVDSSGNVITTTAGGGGGGGGTVTSVATAGTVSGITLTGGPITTTGTITLGGSISGLTTSNLSGTAGITNGQLANSAITIAGTSTSLGGSITAATILTSTGVFSGSAQITGLTNSNLSGTAGITNANLANSSITVGSTAISLGSSTTTIAGISSLTATNLTASVVSASGNMSAGGTMTVGSTLAVTGNTTLSSGVKMSGISNISKQHVLVYDTASAQVSYVTASAFGGGGGGIGGSGTTNYITKFTGTSTVGTSQLIDNGTNIGVNTTTPQYKININQNGGSSDVISTDWLGGNNPFRIGHGYDQSGATPANITSHIAFKPSATWWGYGYYADDITFNVSSATNTPANGDSTGEIMRITADGLVGIRTSTPQAELDVAGIIGSQAGMYDTSGNNWGELHFGHGIGYIGNYDQGAIQTPAGEGMSSNTDIANAASNWGEVYTGRTINSCTSNDNITRGLLVYLENDGFWYRADAKGSNPRMATNLLGIALDNCGPYQPFTVLLDGIIAMDKHTQIGSPPKPGAPLYLETTNVGTMGYVTEIAPALTGEHVRLVGQNIGITSNNTVIIKFQPDNTWIKL